MITALCPGSFDPITLGHLDILIRATKIFDKVIVAIATNPSKTFSFTVDERIDFLLKATKSVGIEIEVDTVSGLLADYAKKKNVDVVVKGLRAMTDFEYEFQMALTNKKLNPELETMFIPTSSDSMFLSSSMVKQVASLGGDISHFVPECILNPIKDRLCSKDF